MESFSEASLLSLAFAVWAIVVAYGVRVLQQLRSDVRAMGTELHNYIVKTESRLAVLEDRLSNNSR